VIPGNRMETVDVIVVGGGIIGASVAWHLAQTLRVRVLEQGGAPGQEATAQNAGLIRRMGAEPAERALAHRTFAYLERLTDEESDAIGVRATGAVLALSSDPLHLHDAVAHLRASDVAVQDLDRPAEVAPILAGSPICRAWFLPDELVADGCALTTKFLTGAKRLGAVVTCGITVTGLRLRGDRIAGVDTIEGPVAAERVVLAGGAWSHRLAAAAGLDRPFIPLRRHLALLRGPRPAGPWVWVDDAGVYVRPDGDDWLACACDETVAPVPDGAGSAGPLTAAATDLLTTKIQTCFPSLLPVEVRRGWSGLRTFAPDRRPVLGADPALRGLWWAAGLGGGGVSGCVGVGEAIATWMAGKSTPWLDARSVAPGRPMLSRWAIYPHGDTDSATLISADAGSLDVDGLVRI
jgi:glycine/D-amino acid oxidase-like deaminating enzyme